jgi:hypothetical protein
MDQPISHVPDYAAVESLIFSNRGGAGGDLKKARAAGAVKKNAADKVPLLSLPS